MTESTIQNRQRAKSINRPKDKKVSLGRPRDLSTDEAILRAAMDLFSRYGIESASIGRIAKRAGVARTTIYRRWSSREELIVHAIENARDFPEQLVEGVEKLEPDELVNLAVRFGAETLTRPQFRRLAFRLIGSSVSHPALMSIYQRKYLLPRRLAFRRILERARVGGLLPPDANVEILCDMLSGAMMYRLFFQPEEHNDGRVRVYLLRLFQEAGFRIPK
jgi:AcrR family transcriptional regulator